MIPKLFFLFPIAVCSLTNSVYAQKGTKTPVSADAIYSGGNILTMVGNEPQYAEALAVKNGRILLVGRMSEAQRSQGPATQVIDLGGKTLLPGFIDAHGHIVDYTLRGNSPDLSPPPVSDVSSIEQLVAKMKSYVAANRPAPGKVAFGMGYDDSLLAERRHPTRADLDRISQEIPILVTHISGHLVAVNSKALELAKITKSTPDPLGGHPLLQLHLLRLL